MTWSEVLRNIKGRLGGTEVWTHVASPIIIVEDPYGSEETKDNFRRTAVKRIPGVVLTGLRSWEAEMRTSESDVRDN